MSVAELKVLGNSLFSRKHFEDAASKYTEAIDATGETELDPRGLAVLYANRAACQLSLRRYAEAQTDAKKATHLDPKYPKAFARLAAAQDAMAEYWSSRIAWQSALDCLSTSDLSPTEQVQRRHAAADMGRSTGAVGERAAAVEIERRRPWELATAMIPSLRFQRRVACDDIVSSAWVIFGAYESFMNGVGKMNALTLNHSVGCMAGIPGVIIDLSNAVMRDSRIFDTRLVDTDFLAKYEKQSRYEANSFRNPWTEEDPEVVIQGALARQREKGWEHTRLGVSLTVRMWIMKAAMDVLLRKRYDLAAATYKCTLHVLQGLRESWKLVAPKDRGAVLETTFFIGVRRLYVDSIMQSIESNNSSYTLEELDQESDLLISQVEEVTCRHTSQDKVDPGFRCSFYTYPRGFAYAVKGYSYNQISRRNPVQVMQFCRRAAESYLKAADCFPEDDELHPWYLNCAVGNMFTAGSIPLGEILDVLERIKVAAPKAKKIWERSALSVNGLWEILEGTAKQEVDLREMVAQGNYTLGNYVGINVNSHHSM
ncbi:hypothetical protein B0H10DRAFT_2224752 [Mycena sp. CBHHK59/15]|nr:hypothetical protein B0H10DRAFT_2224752 [Mycena sp. CBHHK59/15]